MDQNNLVLEISSDEDGDWNEHRRGVSDDGDDCNWFAELFGDGSDEVVVVSEAEKPVKKSKFKSCLVDLDDDCVVLDGDPNAQVDVQNDNPGNGDDDSDDVLVVSEKGQVACRDYPHSRHLCIKFPFSSTANQTHCNQCYCYVCDSLAPCVYWGNGTATTDHCHATDKDEFWILARKNAKNCYKVVQPVTQPPPFDLQIPAPAPLPPAPPQNQIPNSALPLRPALPQNQIPNSALPLPPAPPQNQIPNLASQNQFPDFTSSYINNVLVSRTKLHPDLASQHALRARKKMFNQGSTMHRPVYKRTGTGSVRVATTANQNLYSSYRGNFLNLNSPQVNGILSRSSKSLQLNPILTSSTVNLQQPQVSNQSTPNFQSHVNSNQLFETTRYQQPPNLFTPLSLMPQPPSGQPSFAVQPQPSYPVPSKTTPGVNSTVVPDFDFNQTFSQGNQAQGPIADTGFNDQGLGWPAGQDSATPESTNNSPLAAGGLADYHSDWIFDDLPVEPGFTDYSSDSAFIDTGPIFNF